MFHLSTEEHVILAGFYTGNEKLSDTSSNLLYVVRLCLLFMQGLRCPSRATKRRKYCIIS